MNLSPIGGTPPRLWPKRSKVQGAIWGGLVRDQLRIRRLARQVERLSWMLEDMGNYLDSCQGDMPGTSVVQEEELWLAR